MKKFKGGLYADLGNYKTSLPNTEILITFLPQILLDIEVVEW